MTDTPKRWAAHVELRDNPDGGHTLIVDGTDISNAVLTDGFALRYDQHGSAFLLDVTIAIDELDVDVAAHITATPPRRRRRWWRPAA